MSTKPSIPLLGLYCIVDPDGNLIFTHLCTKPDECIESWLDEERTIKGAILGKVTPSWEVYEAEGYRLTTVDLFERGSLEAPGAREREMADLLRSACAIAEREGAGTHWGRFIASIHKLGLSGITARTYRVLPSDVEAT